MLRRMLLISPEYFNRLKSCCKKPDKKNNQHPYDKWVAFRTLHDPVLKSDRIKIKIKKRKKHASPPLNIQPSTPVDRKDPPPRQLYFTQTPTETPADVDTHSDEEIDDYFVPPGEIEKIEQFGQKHFGKIASPFLAPYYHNKRYLDQVFGIRREDDGTFQIGNSPLEVDENSNIILHNKTFKGTLGLWELLTRKSVDSKYVTKQDLNTYKTILQLTNGHLKDNQSFNEVKTTRGAKYQEVISKIFPPKKKGLQRWTTIR